MSERLLVLLLNGWLVAAVVLFVAILAMAFRPGARAEMHRHARIAFGDGGERDGQA